MSGQGGGPASPPERRDGRLLGWSVVAVIGLLSALLVVDLASLPTRVPDVRTSGDDYLAIIADQRLNRSVNYVIGAALDRGAGVLTRLVVPDDLGTSISRPDDELLLNEEAQPALQVGLLRRAVPAVVETRAYDPVLSDAVIAGWKAAGRIVEYPKDVFLVMEGPADGVWVLCTDAGRSRVYLVPSGDAPRAAVPK